jgi:hypothetical protein
MIGTPLINIVVFFSNISFNFHGPMWQILKRKKWRHTQRYTKCHNMHRHLSKIVNGPSQERSLHLLGHFFNAERVVLLENRSVTIQNFYHNTYHDILDKWRCILWHFVYLCVCRHFFLLRICHIGPWKLKLIQNRPQGLRIDHRIVWLRPTD